MGYGSGRIDFGFACFLRERVLPHLCFERLHLQRQLSVYFEEVLIGHPLGVFFDPLDKLDDFG